MLETNLIKKLDLNLLRVFIVVYKERNLKRAANLVGLSAPSLSLKLSKLKDVLGTELFFKTSTGFEPTEVAHKLFVQVEPLLSRLDDVIESVNGFNPSDIDKPVVVDLGQHFAPWLPFHLHNFISENCPNAYLIADYFTKHTVDRLRKAEVDVGVQIDQADVSKDIIGIPVGEIHGGFIVREDHPIKGSATSIEEVTQYGFAMYEQNITSVGSNGHFIEELDKKQIPYTIKFKSPSALTVHKILKSSNLVLPTSINHLQNDLDGLRIVRLDDAQIRSSYPVLAYIYQENRYSERCKWLIEEIRRIFDMGAK
ncbi:LysR family transcriptional regulator [Photobacterium sp. BZF1]|uniref:LysR family transcriptional regulator n=1 Tax=Photobacterium sp. BZF1 TaxID=1904457 RepID=UPI001653BA2B|nr:LysR family transcriptional regulator [Photobacterium sp. BZF1]MBC7002985.1 LysR family transcriptional regulator [Photobacterium sp. BZF1]